MTRKGVLPRLLGPYDKLWILVFSFLVLTARALRAWVIKGREKNSVHNLPYGPRSRLIRGMYFHPKIVRRPEKNILLKKECTYTEDRSAHLIS